MNQQGKTEPPSKRGKKKREEKKKALAMGAGFRRGRAGMERWNLGMEGV